MAPTTTLSVSRDNGFSSEGNLEPRASRLGLVGRANKKVMDVAFDLFESAVTHDAAQVTREQAPGLHRIIGEVAGRAGVPMPHVFIAPTSAPNVAAFGGPQRAGILITEGALSKLSEREFRAVIGHEIGHATNHYTTAVGLAFLAQGAVSCGFAAAWLPVLGSWLGCMQGNDNAVAGKHICLAMAALAAPLLFRGFQRHSEYLADNAGAEITGDPQGLASALRTLEQSAQGVTAQGLFSDHPPTEERIKRLASMEQSTPPPCNNPDFDTEKYLAALGMMRRSAKGGVGGWNEWVTEGRSSAARTGWKELPWIFLKK